MKKIRDEIKRLQEKKISLQQKLFELKVKIEKTLPNNGNSSLLVNQMEYAIYKISQKKITKSLKHYKIVFKKEFNTFKEVLKKVDFKKIQISGA